MGHSLCTLLAALAAAVVQVTGTQWSGAGVQRECVQGCHACKHPLLQRNAHSAGRFQSNRQHRKWSRMANASPQTQGRQPRQAPQSAILKAALDTQASSARAASADLRAEKRGRPAWGQGRADLQRWGKVRWLLPAVWVGRLGVLHHLQRKGCRAHQCNAQQAMRPGMLTMVKIGGWRIGGIQVCLQPCGVFRIAGWQCRLRYAQAVLHGRQHRITPHRHRHWHGPHTHAREHGHQPQQREHRENHGVQATALTDVFQHGAHYSRKAAPRQRWRALGALFNALIALELRCRKPASSPCLGCHARADLQACAHITHPISIWRLSGLRQQLSNSNSRQNERYTSQPELAV